MHMPIQIDIQQIQQPVPPFLMPVPTHRVQKALDDDIPPDDAVQRPFGAEESDARRGRPENVPAKHPRVRPWGQTFAR